MNEAVRLQQAARTDPKLLAAQQMLDWLRERGKDVIAFREILQCGPSPLRTKKAAETALAVLVDHGWITDASDRTRKTASNRAKAEMARGLARPLGTQGLRRRRLP